MLLINTINDHCKTVVFETLIRPSIEKHSFCIYNFIIRKINELLFSKINNETKNLMLYQKDVK